MGCVFFFKNCAKHFSSLFCFEFCFVPWFHEEFARNGLSLGKVFFVWKNAFCSITWLLAVGRVYGAP